MSKIRTIIGLFLLLVKLLLWVLPETFIKSRQRTKRVRNRANIDEKATKRSSSGNAPVLILSFIEWTGAWQRPHHLAVGLAVDRPVVYATWRRLHHIIGQGSVFDVFHSGLTTQCEGRLQVINIPAFPLDVKIPFLRRLNNLLLLHALRRILPSGARPRVICNAPYFTPMLERFDYSYLIYDVMDELVDDRSKQRAEQWLLQSANRVTTGTWSLSRKKSRNRNDATFVPCGVDYDHFHLAAEPAPPGSRTYEIKRANDLGRKPVAGFFGALNHRLDAALINYLANNASDFDFLFVGPVYSSSPPLPVLQNWNFPGKIDYIKLPDYLRLFDVALIPYHVEGMNKYLHPVKVMEYMAAGVPVVSTPIADVVRFYGDFIQTAETPAEFLAAMRRAVAEPKSLRDGIVAGTDFARRHTWEEFVETFRKML